MYCNATRLARSSTPKALHHTGDELELRYSPAWPAKKRPVGVCPYIFRGGSQRPRGPGPPGGGGAHSTGCCEHRLRRHAHSVCIRAVPSCAQASLDLFHSISIRLRPSKVRGICCFAQPRSRRGRCTLGLANAPGRHTCPSSSPGLLHPGRREQRYD